MSAFTRSKASRKSYAKKYHRHTEAAGKLMRHNKIKRKKIANTARQHIFCRVKAQINCHSVFDRLWQGPMPVMTRWRAYEYLQEISGFCHIRCLDELQCAKVAEQVKIDFPYLFNTRLNRRFAG